MRGWSFAVLCVVLAGCSDAPAPEADGLDATPPVADPAQEPDPEPPAVPLLETTEWEGRTKEGFFVCDSADGTGTCTAGQQLQPDGEHLTVVPYRGDFSGAAIELEWTPADPSQTGLVLVAYGPDGLLNITSGAGDLTLGLDAGMGLPPDGNLTLIVWPQAKAAEAGAALFVDATRQSFSVIVAVRTAVSG